MLDILDKVICDNKTMRKLLSSYVGKEVVIKYDLGRNKHEVFEARIEDLYNCLFIVKLNNGLNKSFSYADVITKTVIIYKKSK